MAHANPIQIQKYLKGVDYPANKAALIENAKHLGADESICASLEQLPDEDFQTPAEVSQAFKGKSDDHAERAEEGPASQAEPQASQAEPQGVGAQQAASSRDQGRSQQGTSAPGSNEFLLRVMQDSLAVIELCMLALRKSATTEVRKFALAMIDEHSKLGQQMEQLAEKMKLDIKVQLTDQHTDMLEKMGRLRSRDFDRRFMEQNLRDHENDLKVFKHYAAEEKDRDLKAMADTGAKMTSKHLKMVKELDKQLQAPPDSDAE
jgi:predicted outer membrane protein